MVIGRCITGYYWWVSKLYKVEHGWDGGQDNGVCKLKMSCSLIVWMIECIRTYPCDFFIFYLRWDFFVGVKVDDKSAVSPSWKQQRCYFCYFVSVCTQYNISNILTLLLFFTFCIPILMATLLWCLHQSIKRSFLVQKLPRKRDIFFIYSAVFWTKIKQKSFYTFRYSSGQNTSKYS